MDILNVEGKKKKCKSFYNQIFIFCVLVGCSSVNGGLYNALLQGSLFHLLSRIREGNNNSSLILSDHIHSA